MTTEEQRRQWMEALRAYRDDSERLFGLVASLANLLDKNLVIETMESVLGIPAVYDGDCVIFNDLAIRFGMYRSAGISGEAAGMMTLRMTSRSEASVSTPTSSPHRPRRTAPRRSSSNGGQCSPLKSAPSRSTTLSPRWGTSLAPIGRPGTGR